MIESILKEIFSRNPEIIYGYTRTDYCDFSGEYQSALVFAVPYTKQLSLRDYREAEFEEGILGAKIILEGKIEEIEKCLKKKHVKYYIPPVAQQSEDTLTAMFSFKFAAVHAGIGWIGKNDVIITEKYGPRIRLSAILIDYPFPYGEIISESKCPTDCHSCISACPYHALSGETWSIDVYRDALIDYTLCNEKRTSFMQLLGRKNACGLCLAACPIGTENVKN